MSSAISTSDFEFVSRLVLQEAAIVLEKGKEYLVESRVLPLARSLGFESISGLVDKLKKENTNKELKRKVVECLTTHETSFFRDNVPFEVLKKSVIPLIIESQKNTKCINIWCGAASSGQEPYSLCMLIRENFPELLSWKVKIYATDISLAILEKAKSGIYSQIEVNRGLPIQLLMKYFEKRGQDWAVKEDLKKMIEYGEQNLLHPFSRIANVDLIMIRNVLIYFDTNTKKEILKKVREVLKPNGFMFLGAAETTLGIDDNFERLSFEKTSCYKKKA